MKEDALIAENTKLKKEFNEISANAIALEVKWMDALNKIDKLEAVARAAEQYRAVAMVHGIELGVRQDLDDALAALKVNS